MNTVKCVADIVYCYSNSDNSVVNAVIEHKPWNHAPTVDKPNLLLLISKNAWISHEIKINTFYFIIFYVSLYLQRE